MLNNKNSVVHFFTTSLSFTLSHVTCLYKAFGFCSQMNAGVLPWLMNQLMVFSRLISIVLSVSMGSWRPQSGSASQFSALGGRGGPSPPSRLQGPPECLCLGVMREEMEGWTSTH